MTTEKENPMAHVLETSYAGCRFRSRLEARWAVFLDRMHIRWMYEPQGYLIDGHPYLPDFYLPDLDLFLEIKGRTPTASEVLDCAGLARLLDCRVALAYGDIPHDLDNYGVPRDRMDWMRVYESDQVDERHTWCSCPRCGCPDIAYEGRSERVRCQHHTDGRCHDAPLVKRTYTGRDDLIVAAYNAARSARFEHGESGAPELPHQLNHHTAYEDHHLDPRREPKRLGDLLAPLIEQIAARATPDHHSDQ